MMDTIVEDTIWYLVDQILDLLIVFGLLGYFCWCATQDLPVTYSRSWLVAGD